MSIWKFSFSVYIFQFHSIIEIIHWICWNAIQNTMIALVGQWSVFSMSNSTCCWFIFHLLLNCFDWNAKCAIREVDVQRFLKCELLINKYNAQRSINFFSVFPILIAYCSYINMAKINTPEKITLILISYRDIFWMQRRNSNATTDKWM